MRDTDPLAKILMPLQERASGEMAEWLKAHAWKACVRETVPWVRIPLSPPAKFEVPYFTGAQGPKSRGFCRCFRSGEFNRRLRMLSIGPGECIFLRNLRTSPGSPIPNLPAAK